MFQICNDDEEKDFAAKARSRPVIVAGFRAVRKIFFGRGFEASKTTRTKVRHGTHANNKKKARSKQPQARECGGCVYLAHTRMLFLNYYFKAWRSVLKLPLLI